MWTVYVAWVGLSTRLSLHEKGRWLLIVILLNMFGMPMFYVFMCRRYLGMEGRTGERDEMALVRFLTRHGLEKERFSSDQLDILRFYCRANRLAKWGVVPTIIVAALMFYTAVVFVPKSTGPMVAGFTPTRMVFIDSATHAKKESASDPEMQNLHTRMAMMFGAMAGMMGTLGFFLIAQSLSQLRGGWHRRALIELLKATNRENVATH